MRHKETHGNTYQEVLHLVVASRRKVAWAFRTKEASEVAFVLEAICKKGSVFKYKEVFSCDNGYELKIDVARLLEKHHVDI